MKVISTNIAQKRTIELNGEMVETGIYKCATSKIYLGKTDVQNDAVIDRRYHGGVEKACYLYGENNYGYFQKKYAHLNWHKGMFGENITLDEVNEQGLVIGAQYQVGEAIIQVTQPRLPCSKLGFKFEDKAIIKDFTRAPFPGFYVQVIKEGWVKAGDEFLLLKMPDYKLTIAELYEVINKKSANKERIPAILENPFVPNEIKTSLK